MKVCGGDMRNIRAEGSALAAFTVFLFVPLLLDRQGRPLLGGLGACAGADDVPGKVFEEAFDIVVGLGAGLAEGQLVLVG
jgi:hypothetical protein